MAHEFKLKDFKHIYKLKEKDVDILDISEEDLLTQNNPDKSKSQLDEGQVKSGSDESDSEESEDEDDKNDGKKSEDRMRYFIPKGYNKLVHF